MLVRSQESERVSKYLARCGVCSRRAAERLMLEGRVKVNGSPVIPGDTCTPGVDLVTVDGRPVVPKERSVYIALNKPQGYLSTCSDPFGRPTVLSLLRGVEERVYPVGRLDYDACGLLLLTNDGKLAYAVTHPRHHVVKEYVVKVAGDDDPEKIKRVLSGIIVGGKKVKADYARYWKGQGLELVLGVHEGEKHLVKNICHALGFEVKKLTRTKIGPVSLTGLKTGEWRYLEPGEVRALYEASVKGREGEYNAGKEQSDV